MSTNTTTEAAYHVSEIFAPPRRNEIGESFAHLEDRTNPSKFSISLLSPLSGEIGDTAATHSGSLALPDKVVDATDATAAVVNGFSGSISVVGAGAYTFGPSTVGAGQAFQIESSGEQFAIAMEDMAGLTNRRRN